MGLEPNNAQSRTPTLNTISQYLDYIFNISNKYFYDKTRLFLNISKKIVTVTSHIRFLLSCRSNDLIPRYIQDLDSNLKHIQFSSNRGKK